MEGRSMVPMRTILIRGKSSSARLDADRPHLRTILIRVRGRGSSASVEDPHLRTVRVHSAAVPSAQRSISDVASVRRPKFDGRAMRMRLIRIRASVQPTADPGIIVDAGPKMFSNTLIQSFITPSTKIIARDHLVGAKYSMQKRLERVMNYVTIHLVLTN